MNIAKMLIELSERKISVEQINESSISGLLREKDSNPSELAPQYRLFQVFLEHGFWNLQLIIWQRFSIIKVTSDPKEILSAIESYFTMVDMYKEIMETIRLAILDLQDNGFKVEIRSPNTLFVWSERGKSKSGGISGNSFTIELGRIIYIHQQKKGGGVTESIKMPENIVKTILMLSNLSDTKEK